MAKKHVVLLPEYMHRLNGLPNNLEQDLFTKINSDRDV